mmetsp:Transcript_11618/g.43649  ORF Transcript_11618/g.43649 Transcript_11618/m.43649 type:complete len:99 (-) Transcript_11618:179-475(-)
MPRSLPFAKIASSLSFSKYALTAPQKYITSSVPHTQIYFYFHEWNAFFWNFFFFSFGQMSCVVEWNWAIFFLVCMCVCACAIWNIFGWLHDGLLLGDL